MTSLPGGGYLVELLPGGDAAEDGVEVVAAQGEKHGGGGAPQLRGVMVSLSVRVEEVADLWQQLLHQHRLVQTEAVLGLLEDRRGVREWMMFPEVRPVQVRTGPGQTGTGLNQV